MPNPVVAIIGMAGTTYGVEKYNKAKREEDDLEAAQDEAEKKSDEFQQQQLEDWEAVYGSTEQNLATYYNNLSPDSFAAVGLEAYDKEYTTAMTRLRETMSQRGLRGSNVQTSLESQAGLQRAEARATIRRDAPTEVAKQQQGFLSLGLSVDPANQYSNYLKEKYNIATADVEANKAEQQAGIDTIVDSLTFGLGEVLQDKKANTGLEE